MHVYGRQIYHMLLWIFNTTAADPALTLHYRVSFQRSLQAWLGPQVSWQDYGVGNWKQNTCCEAPWRDTEEKWEALRQVDKEIGQGYGNRAFCLALKWHKPFTLFLLQLLVILCYPTVRCNSGCYLVHSFALQLKTPLASEANVRVPALILLHTDEMGPWRQSAGNLDRTSQSHL